MLERHWRRHRLTVAVIVTALLGFRLLVHQLHAELQNPRPAGDHAIFETNVRMALEGTQLLGPYSQGFHHPGPAYFYFLALPYQLLGRTTLALHVGALLLSSIVIVACAWLLSRWTASIVPCVLFVAWLVLERGYLGDFPLFDFWPPYAVMLGYALCLVLAAGVVAGHLGASPALIAVACFLVQTHAAYALPVLGALAFVVIGVWRHQRAALRSNQRALFAALALFGLFWALPLYAELFASAGNVGALVRTFVGQPRFAWSASELLDRAALEFTGPFQYLLFGDRFIVPEAPKHFTAARVIALAQIGLLTFGFWRARRRSDRFVEALSLLCLLALPCAVVALLGIRGDVAPHHTAWISSIGVIAVPIAVGGALPPYSWGRKFWPLGVMVLLVASFVLRPLAVLAGIHENREVARLATRITTDATENPSSPLIISWSEEGREGTRHPPAFEWAVALMLELEKRQVPFGVRSAPGLRWALGRARWETTAPGSYTIVLSAGSVRRLGRRLDCVDSGRNNLLRYPICAWAPVEPVSIGGSPLTE